MMDFSESDDEIEYLDVPGVGQLCKRHCLPLCHYCRFYNIGLLESLNQDPEELERETNEMYNQLSAESRADIDAHWGPPNTTSGSAHTPRQQPSNARDGQTITHATILPVDYDSSIRRGTGRVFATKFVPPSAMSTPAQLFPASISKGAKPAVKRFIKRDDPTQFLIYADGACLNNGKENPKAGWAFVYKPPTNKHSGIMSGRLENRGPFEHVSPQTSNRAELRAVFGALRSRQWMCEGFTTLVLATDSEYVAEGATTWARNWVHDGWETKDGSSRKNKDLWEAILGEIERFESAGVTIKFWRISRDVNFIADHAAKQAAEKGEVSKYREMACVLI